MIQFSGKAHENHIKNYDLKKTTGNAFQLDLSTLVLVQYWLMIPCPEIK